MNKESRNPISEEMEIKPSNEAAEELSQQPEQKPEKRAGLGKLTFDPPLERYENARRKDNVVYSSSPPTAEYESTPIENEIMTLLSEAYNKEGLGPNKTGWCRIEWNTRLNVRQLAEQSRYRRRLTSVMPEIGKNSNPVISSGVFLEVRSGVSHEYEDFTWDSKDTDGDDWDEGHAEEVEEEAREQMAEDEKSEEFKQAIAHGYEAAEELTKKIRSYGVPCEIIPANR